MDAPTDISSTGSVHAVTSVENPTHNRDDEKKRTAERGAFSPLHLATVSEEERRDAVDENQVASMPARGGTALKESKEREEKCITEEPVNVAGGEKVATEQTKEEKGKSVMEEPAIVSLGESAAVEPRKSQEEEHCTQEPSHVRRETSSSKEVCLGDLGTCTSNSDKQDATSDAGQVPLQKPKSPAGPSNMSSVATSLEETAEELGNHVPSRESSLEECSTNIIGTKVGVLHADMVDGEQLDMEDKEGDKSTAAKSETSATPPGPIIPTLEVAKRNPYLAPPKSLSTSRNSGNRGMASTPTDLFAPIISPADGLFATEEPEEEEEVKVFEVWVGSCSSHCSAATVIEYGGSFMNVEVSIKLCLNECQHFFL